MSRSRIAVALAACLALASTQALKADVRTDQKTKFQLAGALGKVVNFFGGKAARDGVTSTVALKGNRMMTTTGESTGQIIDLSEEKIYDLDLKKKQYKVVRLFDPDPEPLETKPAAKDDEDADEESGAAKGSDGKADVAKTEGAKGGDAKAGDERASAAAADGAGSSEADAPAPKAAASKKKKKK